MAEKKYTLEEAAAELTKQQCIDHGHDWAVVYVDALPIRMYCSRGDVSFAVTPMDKVETAPSPTAEEAPPAPIEIEEVPTDG